MCASFFSLQRFFFSPPAPRRSIPFAAGCARSTLLGGVLKSHERLGAEWGVAVFLVLVAATIVVGERDFAFPEVANAAS